MKGRNRAALWAIIALAGVLAFVAGPTLEAAEPSGGPAVTLSPTILNFPSQLATTTSAAKTATLTNVGNQPLTITSIVSQGTFSETNSCPTSATLAAGASCTITVTFMAPNGGPSVQPGLVEITDNASPGLQVISLSGTVADFSLVASPTSSMISAGASATYTITATASGGFNQAVSFTCGALPTGASCSFSPSSITPGTNPATGMLTVATTARSLVAPSWLRNPPGAHPSLWVMGLLLGGLASLFAVRKRFAGSRLPVALAMAILLFGALAAGACGGGSSGSGGSVGTPAGTYTVLITGSPTAGPSSLANPLIVTLVVN
ncbi:MAG TPA: hypothetical protein VG206_02270 [Terriglobia bacterium]|nr:hypothetical protein [Terriglobia bacterium]